MNFNIFFHIPPPNNRRFFNGKIGGERKMRYIRNRGSIKYANGIKSLKEGKIEVQEEERLRLLDIYTSLNRQQRLMVSGWLRKGRVDNIVEGLNKINARIKKDSEQGRRGVERD